MLLMEKLEARVLRSISNPVNGIVTITGTSAADVITVSMNLSNQLSMRDSATSTPRLITRSLVTSIRINALAGNDVVTIAQNVTVATIIHGNDGNDTLRGGGGADTIYGDAGNDTLVSVGGGTTDVLWGGDGTDGFWCDGDATEKVSDPSDTEFNFRAVHRISSYSNDVGKGPLGNIPDPIDDVAGTPHYTNCASFPLFASTGPSLNDIRQGALGDCYFAAALSGAASARTGLRIRQSIVDLGDGTYVIRFLHAEATGIVNYYYRMDADLPTYGNGQLKYAQLGTENCIWVALMEKAYTRFRVGGPTNFTYSSIQGGYPREVLSAIGGLDAAAAPKGDGYGDGAQLLDAARWKLVAGAAVMLVTVADPSKVTSSLVANHVYQVTKVSLDSDGNAVSLVLRNPWGTPLITVSGSDAFSSSFDLEWSYM